MKKTIYLTTALIGLFFIVGCNKDDKTTTTSKQRKFGIFQVLDDDKTIEMDGVINSSSLTNFNNLISQFPNIELINIKECEGSMDDITNLQVAPKVYQRGIKTHLMDNGLIASGGVDFYLAGIKRTRGTTTQIGVHSWSDGSNDATDFPVGHAYHQKYIDYYESIGFTQTEAEDFYYFTINAASANSIHWMTEAEIEQYKILTN